MANLSSLLSVELKRQMAGAAPLNLPAGGELLWRWFVDLSRARTYHTGGPNPISYQEIGWYARAMRLPIAPHHVRILKDLDDAFIEVAYTKRGAPEGVKTLPPRSDHAMTGGMFDAMFG